MRRLLFIFILLISSELYAATPILLFSDMTDGPVTGWEESATQGAAVTIYGRNLGSAVHTSYITVANTTTPSSVVVYADESGVAEWAATTNPTVPLGMQRVTFWLNSGMGTDGTYPNSTITVTTSDGTSNSLNFHCRAIGTNKIYFFDLTNGDDSANDGLYDTEGEGGGDNGPKQSLGWLRANIDAGDVAYLKDTAAWYATDTDSGYGVGCISFYNNYNYGTEGNSITVTSYPTEMAQVGVAKGLSSAFVDRQIICESCTIDIDNQPSSATQLYITIYDGDGSFIDGNLTVYGTVGGSPDSEVIALSSNGAMISTKTYSALTQIDVSVSGDYSGGEYISVGYKLNENAVSITNGVSHTLDYWTFSKLKMEGFYSVWTSGIAASNGLNNIRLIGNDASTAYSNKYSDCKEVIGLAGGGQGGNYIYVYGNYIHDPNSDFRGQPSNRRIYHLYIGGYGLLDYIYVGWNEFGWNSSGRAFQIFGHACGDELDHFYYHNNYAHDTSRQVATFGGGEGCGDDAAFVQTAYIYNNIFAVSNDTDFLVLMGGDAANPGHLDGGTFYFYNNVLYHPGAYPAYQVGEVGTYTSKNNTIYSEYNAYGWFWDAASHYCGDTATCTASNNIYHSTSSMSIPAWDTSTLVNEDPLWTDSTPDEGEYLDFYPTVSSPTINAGTSDVDGVVGGTDFLGVTYDTYDIGAFEYDDGGDSTPPTISSATIDAEGDDISVVFSETVVVTGFDADDFDLDCTTAGNGITVTNPTGSGTTWSFDLGSVVGESDTCNLDGPNLSTNDIEDTSGNDMVVFSNQSVNNNSAVDVTAPTILYGTIDTEGDDITLIGSETLVLTGYDALDCNIDCDISGDDIGLSNPTGSGASWSFDLASVIAPGEVCNLDCTLATDDIEDTAGNDMLTFTGGTVYNSGQSGTLDISVSEGNVLTIPQAGGVLTWSQ